MKNAGTPIALLILGVAWLLDSLNWLPDIHWVWIIGMIIAGVAIMIVDGFTKSSVVAGPVLICAGALMYFHHFHWLGWRYMIPIMLIVLGLSMLVSRLEAVPESRTLQRKMKPRANRPDHPPFN